MSAPELLDLDAWPRREHWQHYRHRVPCSYAMTVELDVTAFVAAVRASGRRSYPAQLWAIATAINEQPAFRMTEVDGAPAVWPVVHPMFTVLNPERETFAAVWTPYDRDFARFADAAAALLDEHRAATSMFPQGAPPPNVFDVSSIPWTSFTGFTLDIAGGGDHLAPIVTLGRYLEREGRALLPVAVQIHHAAADGLHTARLVERLRALLAEPDWLA